MEIKGKVHCFFEPRSSVFPITKVLRDHVESVVLEKYQDTVNNKKVTNK